MKKDGCHPYHSSIQNIRNPLSVFKVYRLRKKYHKTPFSSADTIYKPTQRLMLPSPTSELVSANRITRLMKSAEIAKSNVCRWLTGQIRGTWVAIGNVCLCRRRSLSTNTTGPLPEGTLSHHCPYTRRGLRGTFEATMM